MAKSEDKETGVSIEVYEGKGNLLTPTVARKLLGYVVEQKGIEFGDDYAIKMMTPEGKKKVRFPNNPSNRPLRLGIAMRYAYEMLRNKWRMNGETIVIDDKNNIQSGQHRLVALLLAEEIAGKEKGKFPGWKGGIEQIVVYGISHKTDVVDTLDLGQKRTLGDVMFRRDEFADSENASDVSAKTLSTLTAGAVRLVWLRAGGKGVKAASHFPHSEALDFLAKHPGIKRAVEHVANLNEEKQVTSLMSPAYAAALEYLFAASKLDKKTGEIPSEAWDKAEEFWTAFASGEGLTAGSPILALRQMLTKGIDTAGGSGRDYLVNVCVKAWNAFDAGETLTVKELALKTKKDKETGKLEVVENPRCGGLDVEREPEPKAVKETKAAPGGAVKKKTKVEAVETVKLGKGDEVTVADKNAQPWNGVIVGVNKKGFDVLMDGGEEDDVYECPKGIVFPRQEDETDDSEDSEETEDEASDE